MNIFVKLSKEDMNKFNLSKEQAKALELELAEQLDAEAYDLLAELRP